MKTIKLISLQGVLFLVLLTSFTLNSQKDGKSVEFTDDTATAYIEGSWEGFSRGGYNSEPFWGHARITVEEGQFSSVWFTIRDTNDHVVVDSIYGVVHYPGNPEYMQQCVNEEHGIEEYPKRLMISQHLGKVDQITGATWSYNIFKASARTALNDAVIPNEINPDINTGQLFLNTSPNPFSNTFNIEYFIPEPCHIIINIYNSEGKVVKGLVNGYQYSGNHLLTTETTVPEGVYFIMLKAGNTVQCNRIIKKL